MTDKEIALLLNKITVLYPAQFKTQGKAQSQLMVATWLELLGQYDTQKAFDALKMFVANDKKGFPPVPGQLIDIVHKMTPSPYPDAEDAWQQVRASVSYSDYHDAFDSLPAITQKVLGAPSHLDELRHMNTDTLEKSEKPRFIRKYEELLNDAVMKDNAGIRIDPPKTERLETMKKPAATDEEGNAKYSPRGKYLTGLEVQEYAKSIGYDEGSANLFYLFCFSHGIDRNQDFIAHWKECYMAFYDGDNGWLQSYLETKKEDATSADGTVTQNATT